MTSERVKSETPGEWSFMRAVENVIEAKLGRKVLLDDISITDREKLWYLANHESNEYLSKTLNEILDVL